MLEWQSGVGAGGVGGGVAKHIDRHAALVMLPFPGTQLPVSSLHEKVLGVGAGVGFGVGFGVGGGVATHVALQKFCVCFAPLVGSQRPVVGLHSNGLEHSLAPASETVPGGQARHTMFSPATDE